MWLFSPFSLSSTAEAEVKAQSNIKGVPLTPANAFLCRMPHHITAMADGAGDNVRERCDA